MTSSINIELSLDAQRIVQKLHIHNTAIEEHVEKAMEKGLRSIFDDENFEDNVANIVKSEFERSIKQMCNSWVLKNKLQETIDKAMASKIDNLAEEFSQKLVANIEKLQTYKWSDHLKQGE